MGKNLGMGAFKSRYLCSENGRGLSIWIWLSVTDNNNTIVTAIHLS